MAQDGWATTERHSAGLVTLQETNGKEHLINIFNGVSVDPARASIGNRDLLALRDYLNERFPGNDWY